MPISNQKSTINNAKNMTTFLTFQDDPSYERQCDHLAGVVWPEFMLHDPAARLFDEVYKRFPDCQVVVLDDQGEPAAFGNTVPLWWSGKTADLPAAGWDAAIARGAKGLRANTLCALQAMVHPNRQGSGWSTEIIKAMRAVAQRLGYTRLIAPVRPNQKHLYPLIPIEKYMRWVRSDGLPFDAWLRVHARLGARVARAAPRSMRIVATVAEWEARTGLVFPASGDYIVPGALVPLRVNRARDRAIYVEPNVWMVHELELIADD